MPVILTVVIAGLIIFYVGWVIYKSARRTKNGKNCCECENCVYKNKFKKTLDKTKFI
ncbi:MAG: FeoB-associated Cys-rich membrane protein [Oscillospiraceae bacterium]|nr:FeoB-associated Cys-rich membrane protein [Oscillospiraceae bacterium]